MNRKYDYFSNVPSEWKLFRDTQLIFFLKYVFHLTARRYWWMLPSSQLPHLSCWSMQFLHSSSENSHIGSFTAAAELSRKQSTRLRLVREEDSRMLSIQRLFADKSAIAGEFPVCHSTQYMLSSHNRNTGVLN